MHGLMSTSIRWVQAASLAVLAVAAVPLALNQWAEIDARGNREGRAHKFAMLGKEALDGGDAELAVRAYAEAVAAAPDDQAARRGLVDAYVARVLAEPSGIDAGNVIALQAELTRALAESAAPAPRLLLAYGRVLMFRGQNDQARQHFQKAVEAKGDLALARLLLGDLLLKSGSYDAAAVELEKALEIEPANGLARFALGQVRARQERWDEAIKHLEAAREKVDNAVLLVALGRAYGEKQTWPKAVEAFEQALARGADAAAVGRHLGDAYANVRQAEKALHAYEMAWKNGNDVEGLRRYARLAQKLGDVNAAADAFGRLRFHDPDDPEAHCGIATSAEALGEGPLALGAYTRCAELAEARKEEQFAQLAFNARQRVAQLSQALAAAKATPEAPKKPNPPKK